MWERHERERPGLRRLRHDVNNSYATVVRRKVRESDDKVEVDVREFVR